MPLADEEYSSNLICAIDQGTSSTRCLIFSSKTAELITSHQIELNHVNPNEGWMEIDALEILDSTKQCINQVCEKLTELKFDVKKVKALGISNQRETTVVWDKRNGKPFYNAVVWCDNRTEELAEKYKKNYGGKNAFQKKTGLVIHPYFSALKIRWLLDNVKQAQMAAKTGNLMAGTIDTWLIWNLTGGTNGGQFVTDVTNASRTLLMNIRKLKWDDYLLKVFDIKESMLPTIKSSSEVYGLIIEGALSGVPISGCLGDQQAALVGEFCFKERMCKNTYGTGCFLLANTGPKVVFSKSGLLTTVAYKFGPDKPAYYALEGSIAVAGQCIRWLRDNLRIIGTSREIEELARSVKSTHDVYFVPAFSGLYAPYWHAQARGLIIGLTGYTTKAHIARAALESVCFQTREVLEAMCKDGGVTLSTIKLLVDGGMTKNELFMQIQADLLGTPVIRPQLVETASLGAAIAAGLAKGVELLNIENLESHPPATDKFVPKLNATERDYRYARWKDAVKRSMNWTGDGTGGVSMCKAICPVLVPCGIIVTTVCVTLMVQRLFSK